MRTIKLLVQYDGTGFVGWQRQEQGTSIQGLLEDALARIDGAPVTVHGAGRTDAGVHAIGQTASARIRAAHDPPTLVRAMNAALPPAVRIAAIEDAADGFHARFSARGKTYEYRVWNGPVVPPFVRAYVWHVPQPLDVDAMRRAAAVLEGEHDFAAFRGAGSVVSSTVRRLTRVACRDGRPDAPVTVEVAGTGFLRHMVRTMAGTLVDIGLGRTDAAAMAAILEGRDRSRAGSTAPACGLFLMEVAY